MPLYETTLVANASASAASILKLFRRCTREVTDRGGVMRDFQNLGARQLAYRMRAHQRWNYVGRYFVVRFEASPRAIREVHHIFKTNESVVRWLTQRRRTASRKPLVIKGRSELGVDPGVYLFKEQQHLDWKQTRMMLQSGMLKPEQLRERMRRVVVPGEDKLEGARR